MEANAPEKIYLVHTTRIIDEWRKKPSKYGRNIEYTRTDAFIEKAEKWIKDNGYMYNGECEGDVKAMAEDFVNYMKGE